MIFKESYTECCDNQNDNSQYDYIHNSFEDQIEPGLFLPILGKSKIFFSWEFSRRLS